MAHISRKEWDELVELRESSAFSKKEALIKFSVSLFLILIYLFIVLNIGLVRDLQLGSGLLVINIAGILGILGSRAETHVRWVTYISLILFMWYMAFIAFHLQNTRGLVYYLAPTVLYYFEMEGLAWKKWQIPAFVISSLIPLFVIPYDALLLLSTGLILLFSGVIVYKGNQKRLELLLLQESQKGYELFMKHTRLLEHHVINSISKLVYVSEMLKDIQNGETDSDLKEMIQILDQEIASIGKTITETDRKDLKEFNI